MQTTESKVQTTFGETTFNDKNISFRQSSSKKGENFFTRYFGSKNFIIGFWKLLLPSLIWGFITSLVPLLFNVFTAYTFNKGQGLSGGNEFLAINYTYGIFSTFNSLITVPLFAVFPVVGNFIARNHYQMMRQTIRWAMYIGFSIAFILMIFEQIFATNMMNLMVWNNQQSGNQTTLSVNLLRFLSFIGFFYLWGWLYIPTLSSIKNTKAIFFSSLTAFIFFIITTPTYLHFVGINFNQNNNLANQISDHAFLGLGAIYLIYFMIQPIYLYIYCRFVKQFRTLWYRIFKSFYDKHQHLIKNEHLEKELLFMDSFKVSINLLKRIFKLSWCIILDQSLFSIISIIQLVFIINFGGHISSSNVNFQLLGSNSYLAAANYYKDITSIAFMLQIFLFGIFNAFTIAPQYFIANELGKNNKKEALHNSYLCLNWSIILGIIFMIAMFICGATLNDSFFPRNNQTYYYIYINNTSGANVTFNQLYLDSSNIMYIFAGFMIINTMASMVFFIMIEGGSKLTVVADSLVQIIFTIILIILYVIKFNNMYWYFTVTQIMFAIKVIAGYLIIGFKQSLNSIDYHQLDEEVVAKSKLAINY